MTPPPLTNLPTHNLNQRTTPDPNVASLARSMCPHLYRGDLRCRGILLAEQVSGVNIESQCINCV